MAKSKLQNIVPFGLRLQPDLKSTLEKAAHAVPRSLNAEIVQRLEESLTKRHELAAFSDGELIDELISRFGRDAVFIQLGKKKDES